MTSVEDLLVNLSINEYNIATNDKKDLDKKAEIYLMANGVFLGLILNALDNLNKYLALIAIIAILFSSVSSLMALTLRKYKALDIMKIWEDFKKDDITDFPLQAKRNVFSTIDDNIKTNRENIDNIAEWVKKANISFFIALIFVTLAITINF